jgi:hypothetical protein
MITCVQLLLLDLYCDGFAQGIAGQQPAELRTVWVAVVWYPSRYDVTTETVILSVPCMYHGYTTHVQVTSYNSSMMNVYNSLLGN